MKTKKKRDTLGTAFASIIFHALAATLLVLLFLALAGSGCAQPQTEGVRSIFPSLPPTPTGESSAGPVSVYVEPEVSAADPADVYVLRVGGSGFTRLTDFAGDDLFAGWSPDSKDVLFVSSRDGNSEIYAVCVDGSELRRLTDHPAQDWSPVWSSDGEHIAFESLTDPAQYIRDIWVMNPDGSERRRLTDGTRDSTFPVWSPAGTHILYVASSGTESDIYLVDANGENGRSLTAHPANDEWPSWSPAGQHIAFVSDRDGNWEIYTMNSDGSGQSRLTFTEGDETYPTWSPDGHSISFTSNHLSDHPDRYDLFVMDADGGNVKRLTDSSLVQFPDWAPDSSRIAFSMWDEMRSIYVVSLSDGEMWRVPNQPSGDVLSAAWSPDGEMLGFTVTKPFSGREELSWDVYRFASGVSLTYPAAWSVEPDDAPGGSESAWFRPATHQAAAVVAEISDRPSSDRAIANPYTWEPNEGGYRVQWAQPISAGDLEGLMFVWGARLDGEWQGMPALMAIYYSVPDALDIRLTTEFTPENLELARAAGMTETLTTQFDLFRQMVKSIRVER